MERREGERVVGRFFFYYIVTGGLIVHIRGGHVSDIDTHLP